MLRVVGSRKRLCDGLSRRDLLRATTLGLASAGLAAVEPRAAAARQTSGRAPAQACIILYLYGAPSQLELFDPKPEAPAEIRGEFGTIDTALAGVRISEHLPRLARVLDRCTLVRSMTHPYNIHSAAYTLTGVGHVDVPMELNPSDSRHWPYLGSVLQKLAEQSGTESPRAIPRHMALPFPFSSRATEFTRGGPYGGFLGRAYDPVWTEFDGRATRTVERWRGNRYHPVDDPYAGIEPGGRFLLSRAAEPLGEITLDRLSRRRSLLEQFDAARRDVLSGDAIEARNRSQQLAFSLLASDTVRGAIDLERETSALRNSYGMTLFGQAVLAARRLVEAGCQLVTVFWDEVGTANSAWDTHFNHFDRLKNELLPGLDLAFSGLIHDLESRGLLDTTLVACISEHGRTPRLDSAVGGGRNHWSRAYSGLFAGGGLRAGELIGRTDAFAGEVTERPVSPKEILATLYHQLGVDPHQMMHDRLGRPLPLVSDGEVVSEMLA